jgi:hypothetical protein
MIRCDLCMPTTHGQAAAGGTRTYHAWKSMVRRCTNPSSADWARYGGRGISVCSRWLRFEDFLADMGGCPDGLSLDRINNEGNYEPGNCRWTTWEQQMRNRRSNSGELHANAKLTADQVLSIRRLARLGSSHDRLAREFRVSRTNIRYIVQRKAWKDLVDPTGRRPSARQREVFDSRDLGA